jgi:hypothetical protein
MEIENGVVETKDEGERNQGRLTGPRLSKRDWLRDDDARGLSRQEH